jgi:hypothetical protein
VPEPGIDPALINPSEILITFSAGKALFNLVRIFSNKRDDIIITLKKCKAGYKARAELHK